VTDEIQDFSARRIGYRYFYDYLREYQHVSTAKYSTTTRQQEQTQENTMMTEADPSATATHKKDLELCDIDTHGGETLSTFNHHNSTTSSDPYSDELLTFTAKGFQGLIERVPMPVKLLSMALAALVGMVCIGAFLIVIQSIDIRKANDERKFVHISVATSDTVLYLQRERETIVQFLSESQLNSSIAIAKESFETTDLKLKLFGDKVKSLSAQNAFEATLIELQQLNSIRQGMLNFTVEGETGFNYYSKLIDSFAVGLSSITRSSSSIEGSDNLVSMLRIGEYQYALRTGGEYLFAQKQHSLTVYYQLVYYISARDSLLSSVLYSMSHKEIEYYYRAVNSTSLLLAQMESYLTSDQWNFTTTGPLPNVTQFSKDLWSTTTKNRLLAFQSVQSYLTQGLTKQAEDTVTQGTSIIVGIIVVILFFFIVVLLCSSLTSCSIIGPWRRLNKMQEIAISRFVPQQFLRLMNVKRINEIELGKYEERKLTIMNISMGRFAKLTSGMKPEQILQFTNSYFGYIGPIIRKFGFVQNYNGDGLVALYKSQKKALSASVELQLATSAYNLNVASKNDFPLVEVGISVQSGTVLVAIVGENERMECTIISSHTRISAKLDSLIHKLNLRVLTTALEADTPIQKSVTNQVGFRALGSLEAETSSGTQLVQVFEIVKSSDKIKLQLNHDFSQAVELFQSGRFPEAEPIFASIASELIDDTVCKLYLKKCEQLLQQVRMMTSNLGVQDILKDDELFHGFEVFCQQEFSAENIVLWSEIEQYKVQPETKRRTIARRLRKEYLSLSGRKTININQTLKTAVANQISDDHSGAPAADLFSDIQNELELLMTDTCNRYKASSLFFESLARSKYAIKAPYLDQL